MMNKMIKKRILSIFVMILMAYLMSACGKTGAAQDSKARNKQHSSAQADGKLSTIVYGSKDYTRMNPAMDEHGEINILIFDGLTAHNGSNEVVPGLAKRWDFDEQTNTYTFYLEEGVKWHDGEAFTGRGVYDCIDYGSREWI